MEKIYSKYNNVLTHIIYVKDDFSSQGQRDDLVSEDNYLQVATLNMPKGTTFKPHIHNEYLKVIKHTQEAWVIIQGSVRALLYDIDGKYLDAVDLYAGDMIITLYGGHTYKALEKNTFVYEIKNGPYYGQLFDKHFI